MYLENKRGRIVIMIVLINEDSFVEISEIGARVTELVLGGIAIVRRDDGDNSKRSGIPVLGPLVDANTGIWQKVAPTMPQHGTDRITEWKVIDHTDYSATLQREYDGSDHPFIGMSSISFSIESSSIFSLTRTTVSENKQPVPLGTGLHTYFLPEAQFPQLSIFPIENGKSYHLEGMTEIEMHMQDKKFLIKTDPTPLETVIWAENKNDHICVEPWWAKVGDAPLIHPDESRIETYTIQIVSSN